MADEKKASGVAAKQGRSPWLYILAASFIIALILVNLQLFFGVQIFPTGTSKHVCYEDACFVGKVDPMAEIGSLINSSNHLLLVGEGDPVGTKTQTSAYIGASLAQLSAKFWRMNVSAYGIEVEDNRPIGCINYTLEYCQSLSPGPREFMIRVKYPSSLEKNEIRVDPDQRTITFQAKSGLETSALVEVFKRFFP